MADFVFTFELEGVVEQEEKGEKGNVDSGDIGDADLRIDDENIVGFDETDDLSDFNTFSKERDQQLSNQDRSGLFRSTGDDSVDRNIVTPIEDSNSGSRDLIESGEARVTSRLFDAADRGVLETAQFRIDTFKDRIQAHFLSGRSMMVRSNESIGKFGQPEPFLEAFIEDDLRGKLGAFHIASEEEASFVPAWQKLHEAENLFYLVKIETPQQGQQTVELTPTPIEGKYYNPQGVLDVQEWKDDIDSIWSNVEGEGYTDYSTFYSLPFDADQVNPDGGTTGYKWADATSQYNFLDREYEESITQDGRAEIELPNAYIVNQQSKQPDKARSEGKDKITGMDFSNKSGDELKKQLTGFSHELRVSRDTERLRNIIITSQATDDLEEVNQIRHSFPMYSEVDLDTRGRVGLMVPFLNNYGLDVLLSKEIIGANIRRRAGEDVESSSTKVRSFISIMKDAYKDGDDQVEIDDFETLAIDLPQFFNKFLSKDFKYDDFSSNVNMANEKSVIITGKNEGIPDLPDDHFQRLLYIQMFMSSLKSIVEQEGRTWLHAISGQPTAPEVLYYKIEKFKVPDLTNNELPDEPMQTFYVVNPQGDRVKVIDSQVIFDEGYVYKVSIGCILYGTTYSYANYDVSYANYDVVANKEAAAKFWINYGPSIELVELPYYEERVWMIDKPPVFPGVNFVPYKGKDDQFLVLLDSNSGDYADNFIPFSDDEVWLELRQKAGHKRKNTIRFTNDEPPTDYEVRRLVEEPVNGYDDFREANPRRLDALEGSAFLAGANVNRPYWFMFRAFDYHGNVSNPSPIFQVELKENSGFVNLDVKVYDPESKDTRPIVRSGQKFMYIAPTFAQGVLNYEESGLNGADSAKGKDIILGTEDESIYGKRFKIRLRSKKTNREADINLTFKITKETEEE